MSINSANSTSIPGVQLGFNTTVPLFGGGGNVPAGGTLQFTMFPKQVMGLTALWDCCAAISIPGTSGCASFTITVTGDISGTTPGLVFTFLTPTGIKNILNVIFNDKGSLWTCTDAAAYVAEAINIAESPYTATSNGCIVTVCIPADADPQYFGSTVRIQCQKPSTSGTISLVGGCPKTITLGTASSFSYSTDNCGDCRQGQYKSDIVPDDKNLQLLVFSKAPGQPYFDYNAWLISYPNGYDAVNNGDFKLQQLIGGLWVTKTTLTNNNFGLVFNNALGVAHKFNGALYPLLSQSGQYKLLPTCKSVNYQGCLINWDQVYQTYGAGTYRFAAIGNAYTGAPTYCKATNPFCLSAWNCQTADHTVKFEAWYTGGNIGDVNTQGVYWNLDCPSSIFWADAIRFYGFTGAATDDLTRDQIKYQTGIITKVRDELIKKYKVWISPMPDWFHKRFAAYALMADQLFVTDDNLNNRDYTLNHFFVVADSGYDPVHKFETRYARIDGTLTLKEGQQFVFRDRC